MEVLRSLVRNYFLPLLILSVLAADWMMWRLGWSTSDWIIYTYNGTALILVGLEFLIPRVPSWNYINKNGILWRETAVEIFFFFWGGWFAGAVTYPFSQWVAGHLREALGLSNTIPLPLVLQAIIIVLYIDLFRYWLHRWMHEYPMLWRFHALHHVPERLGTMTSVRTHPVDDFLLYVPEMIILFSVGFDRTLVAVLYSVIWVISLVKHANVEIGENWFTRHFQIPQYHLRHHESHDGKVPTPNFSEVLTLWDRVFGSFAGAKVPLDHQVGVTTEKRRTLIREMFGWAYLSTDKL